MENNERPRRSWKNEFKAIDTETTGLSKKAKVIELAGKEVATPDEARAILKL